MHLVNLELYVKDSLFEIILEVLKTICALILKFGVWELAASPSISSGRARPTRLILHVHPRPPPQHLACMSLLTKDIDMAIVAAANILGYPHSWTSLSKSGVLSDTGNCKTYRDDADGYCRGDFFGTVVLKHLEDAVAQNYNILAVLAGSGRDHSGNSTSITTSDAGTQERLERSVRLCRVHESPRMTSRMSKCTELALKLAIQQR